METSSTTLVATQGGNGESTNKPQELPATNGKRTWTPEGNLIIDDADFTNLYVLALAATQLAESSSTAPEQEVKKGKKAKGDSIKESYHVPRKSRYNSEGQRRKKKVPVLKDMLATPGRVQTTAKNTGPEAVSYCVRVPNPTGVSAGC
ncbi:unnamed protein product [Calypogeia fissa]